MLLVVAAGTFLMGLILLIRVLVQVGRIGKRKSWLTTEGHLVKNETRQGTEMVKKSAFKKKEAMNVYFPDVEYTYTVDRAPYTGTVYSFAIPQGDFLWAEKIRSRYEGSRNVMVTYNPADPSQSFLVEDRSGIKTLTKSMFILFAVAIGSFLVGLAFMDF